VSKSITVVKLPLCKKDIKTKECALRKESSRQITTRRPTGDDERQAPWCSMKKHLITFLQLGNLKMVELLLLDNRITSRFPLLASQEVLRIYSFKVTKTLNIQVTMIKRITRSSIWLFRELLKNLGVLRSLVTLKLTINLFLQRIKISKKGCLKSAIILELIRANFSQISKTLNFKHSWHQYLEIAKETMEE
jgi:hypothetical protein